MSKSNEKELMKLAARGDVSAFEELIFSHQKKVYNIAVNYTKNHDDALEISQEALIKAFRNIKNFKGDCSFSTWIFRITTNTCIDHYRKNSNISCIYIDGEKDIEDGTGARYELKSDLSEPLTAYLQKELRLGIRKALNSIPVELKTVVILRDIHGFCYEEISSIVGIPLGTIKSRISRARQFLKQILLRDNELFNKKDV